MGSGFLTLIQSGERPDRYGRSRRLATMPSRPMAQACRNTVVPSVPSRCSERRMPSPALRSRVIRMRAARLPWLAAQIVAIKLQQVEGVQEGVPGALAAHGSAEPVEVGHAIGAAHHALAVDGDGSDWERSSASAITGARSL